MAKKSHLFNDFDTGAGSYNLFEKAMRQAIEYDANDSDLFDAKVLTRPTLVTKSPSFENERFNIDPDKTETFAFVARILGTNSPHRFLNDPCKIEDTENAESRRKAFNLIQMHTKVFLTTDVHFTLPELGDIVQVQLERGSYGSFKTDKAQFSKIVLKNSQMSDNTDNTKDCITLASAFVKSDFKVKPLESYSSFPRKMTYNGASTDALGRATTGAMVENGKLPEEILFTVEQGLALTNYADALTPELLGIPTKDTKGRTIKFIKEAIVPFIELAIKFNTDLKQGPMQITDSYRPYERQEELAKDPATANYAATPGTSNHGWGVAFDISGTNIDMDGDNKVTFADRQKTDVYKWLQKNGGDFTNPLDIKEGWHWENVKVRDQIYETPIEGPVPASDFGEPAPEETK